MKTVKLTDVIKKECENKKFAQCFKREMLINKLAEKYVRKTKIKRFVSAKPI